MNIKFLFPRRLLLNIVILSIVVTISGCANSCDNVEAIDESDLKNTSINEQHGWSSELPVSVEEFTTFMKSHKYVTSPFESNFSSVTLLPVEMSEEIRREISGSYKFSRPTEHLRSKNTCQPFMRNYIAYTDSEGLIIYIDDAYNYSGI